MLNTMESQRNVVEHLIPVPQFTDHHDQKAPPAYNSATRQNIKQRSVLNFAFLTSEKCDKLDFKILLHNPMLKFSFFLLRN